MDRTIIETYRAEEKELSHLLCEKMKGLMLLQPAQEELRKHVHDEMFLKINHQGFFHVMAFLCRLYDPIEFRKRFLWPLTDKRSEANFRTSTIDYMKYLNEKYQLNWLNIKQYLVIMPGGMKFITFLLDFIKFIISEQIKQREKHFIAMELQEITKESIDDVVSEANIYSVLRKNICLKESSSDYLNALHDVNNILELKISVITEQLQEISNQTNFGINLLMSETFLEKFWSSIQLLYKERFLIKPLSVRNMEKPLEEFKLLLNEFHNKEINLTCNKNANKKEFLNNLKEYGTQKNLPQIKGIIDEYEVARRNDARWNEYVDVDDDDIDINLLMRIFNCIYKPLTMELSKINQKSQPSEFIVNKIDDLLVKLQQMKEQLNNFQKMIYSKSNNNNNLTVKSNQPQAETDAKHATCTPVKWQRKQHRRWNRMLLSTPPIIQNDFQEIEAAKCKRIRLIDMTIANSISSGSGSSNNNNNRNVNNGVKSQMDWLTSNFYERCHIKSTLPEVTIAHNQHRQSDDSDDESNINATIVDTRALLSSLKKANNDKSIKSGNFSDLYKDDNNDGDDGDDDNDDNLNCTIRTLGGKEHLTACKSKSPTKLNRLQMRQQQQQQYSLLSPYSPNCHMTPKHSSHKRQQLQEQRRNSGNKGSAAARKLFARDTDMHNNDVRINLNISPSGHLKSPNDAEILKSFECHTNIIAATTTTATTTTLTPTLTSKPKICLNNITIKDNDTNDIDHNRHHQPHLNEQTLNSSQDQELSNDNNNLGDINDLFNTSDTVLKVVTP